MIEAEPRSTRVTARMLSSRSAHDNLLTSSRSSDTLCHKVLGCSTSPKWNHAGGAKRKSGGSGCVRRGNWRIGNQYYQVTLSPAFLNWLKMVADDRQPRVAKHTKRRRLRPRVIKHWCAHQVREQCPIPDCQREQRCAAASKPSPNSIKHARVLIAREVPERVISDDAVKGAGGELDFADVGLHKQRLRAPDARTEQLFARKVDADNSMAAPKDVQENRRPASATQVKY